MESAQHEGRSARLALVVLGLLFILLPLTVIGLYLLPSPMALMAPGPVEPLDSLISVEGNTYTSEGHLYLTAIRLTLEPRYAQYLLARLQPDVQLVPKEQVVPAFMTREDFERYSQRLLEESQRVAEIVALRQTGCDVRLGPASIEVVAIAPGSPAAELLQTGDRIEAADGEPIEAAAELVSIVQGRLNGEPVTLRVTRAGRARTVTLPAVQGPLDSGGPVLGVVAVTSGLDYRSPMQIKIDPGSLTGGPSVGLMYALGVYNALVTRDITRGHKIAGTGTLRLNGAVGPVAGVRLKVRAAEQAGADYFLAPAEDAAAARAAAQDIKIIPVRSFKEALTALEQLDMAPGSSPRVVPASGDTILASRAP